jgi:hypothetical protein
MRTEIGVPEIVKQIRVPLTGANQGLVSSDRFLEVTLREFLVRFGKFSI